jgi:hypothetical protein
MGTLAVTGSAGSLTLEDIAGTAVEDGDGQGTGTWQNAGRAGAFSIEHTGAAIDTGEIPLGLGGDWIFASSENPDVRCTSAMRAASFTNSCTRTYEILDGSSALSATRTAGDDSIFGDLGGTWSLVAGPAECAVTLTGALLGILQRRRGHGDGHGRRRIGERSVDVRIRVHRPETVTVARATRCLALLVQACGGPAPAMPVLLLEEDPPAVARQAADSGWAAHFALRSQSDPGMEALRLDIDDLCTRLESVGNPLLIDLEDESVEQDLRRSLARHLPRITAARWLSSARWTAADESVGVRLASDCAGRKRHETCLNLDDRRRDTLARRARFAAWPIAAAAWIHVADEPLLPTTVESLRTGGDDPASTIALVLTAPDLRFSRTPAEHLFDERLARFEILLRRRSPAHAPTVAAWRRTPSPRATFPGLSLAISDGRSSESCAVRCRTAARAGRSHRPRAC